MESQINKEAGAETPNLIYSSGTRQQLEALLKELRICKSPLLPAADDWKLSLEPLGDSDGVVPKAQIQPLPKVRPVGLG